MTMNLATIKLLLLIANFCVILRVFLIFRSMELEVRPMELMHKVFFDTEEAYTREDVVRDALRAYIAISAVLLPIVGGFFIALWLIVNKFFMGEEPLGKKELMFMVMLCTNIVWLVSVLILYATHGRHQLLNFAEDGATEEQLTIDN
jgi:hypothetical protein